MQYTFGVFLLSVFVNLGILVSCAQLYEKKPKFWRIIVSAICVGTYTAACTIYLGVVFSFFFCRIGILLLAGWISFGFELNAISFYLILTFAIEGVVNSVGTRNNLAVLTFIVFILSMILLFAQKGRFKKKYIPVELRFGQRIIKFKALYDTGNILCDPITGTPVLIIDLYVSELLTGLSRKQLKNPIEVMREPPIPGLRLIPFKTISQTSGLVLGIQIPYVRIGNRKGSAVVAFAPEVFSDSGEFNALTGGML